jgi:hypothetical protein
MKMSKSKRNRVTQSALNPAPPQTETPKVTFSDEQRLMIGVTVRETQLQLLDNLVIAFTDMITDIKGQI